MKRNAQLRTIQNYWMTQEQRDQIQKKSKHQNESSKNSKLRRPIPQERFRRKIQDKYFQNLKRDYY